MASPHNRLHESTSRTWLVRGLAPLALAGASLAQAPETDSPSLKSLEVQQPPNLAEFVTDNEAAIRLGKALFWDIQAGSDGLTACASCHYHSGADNRRSNMINPGPNKVFDVAAPNQVLIGDDFPFVKFADPETGTTLLSSMDDIRGSQGVVSRTFDGINPASTVDDATDRLDRTFNVGGINTIQVTGRDAPTVMGAAFFDRLFWDGRAQSQFNGANIWGGLDNTAQVLEMLADGGLGQTSIILENSALASQAVGPPLSHAEMSWGGRSFANLGAKLIGRQPLAGQFVDPTDPVLGSMANLVGNGLDPALSYSTMIQAAFAPRWWGSAQLTADRFTQMEANFSLFWGLAIQMYEQTLIPDDAPYDRFVEGDLTALSFAAQRGRGIFNGKGNCSDCHATPMFAGSIDGDVLTASGIENEGPLERMLMASWASGALTLSTNAGEGELPLNFGPSRKILAVLDPQRNLVAWRRLPRVIACGPPTSRSLALNVNTAIADPATGFEARVTVATDGACNMSVRLDISWNELGPPGADLLVTFAGAENLFRLTVPAPTKNAVYDDGFYNIGVTPTHEDLGIGGNGSFGPLSFTRRHLGGELFDTGIGPILPGERVAVDGSFKAQTLRNIELTGPYMHNGSMKSLEEVVEFYARKANFAVQNGRDLATDIKGFGLFGTDKADLVAFLESLTDERVRLRSDVFSHPELPLKRGSLGDELSVTDDGSGNAIPDLDIIGATGAAGGPAISAFDDSL